MLAVATVPGVFLAIARAYDRAAGAALAPWDLAGLATFALFFVALRLADNLDDLALDLPGDESRQLRRRRALLYVSALSLVAGVIFVLNRSTPRALVVALAALTLMLATPFVVKRHISRRRAVLVPAYESIPAALLVYCPARWTDLHGAVLPLGTLLPPVLAFLAGYQFWKLSRKLNRRGTIPYLRSLGTLRVTLLALLAVAVPANLLMVGDVSAGVAIAAAALPVGFALWLLATWSDVRWPTARDAPPTLPPAPPWTGISYLVALTGLVLMVSR